MDEIAARLEFAVTIAREAGLETLKLFGRKDLGVDRKSDDSPVTAADRNAEELLRRRIGEQFSKDAILGEEYGDQPGTTGFRWVLDPIDGTKSFIYGIPLYTTLVAVCRDTENGEPEIGVIHAPATGEVAYAASGAGCWYQVGESDPVRATANSIARLSESLMLTSEVASFGDERQSDATDVYISLEKQCRLARTWGDAYGYMMVATGRAEVMIDPKVSLWDVAAVKPIVEEAGGRFTDWQGNATAHSGDGIATNSQVHEAVLSLTRGR